MTINNSLSKTTVFNLIILDESGSMSGIENQTLSGCNETLNVIRSTAKEKSDKIRSLVSVYAFQSGSEYPSRYLVKNAKPEEVRDITVKDYHPLGSTPLLDAVGSTLSELKAVASTHENATGIVTIITDGYENSSEHYTWQSVGNLILQLKEIGWTINLIGANIDVEKMAKTINVDNRMAFTADANDTKRMFNDFSRNTKTRMCEYAEEDCNMAMEERIKERKANAKNFFKK